MGLRYYTNIEDAPLSDLLRQSITKTDKLLMVFSDSRFQYCPETGRSTGAYILFYQGVTIDHCIHVPVPIAQYSAESEYNSACTTGTALSHFRVLNNEFLNKNLDVVP